VNFLTLEARGLVSVAVANSDRERLGLQFMRAPGFSGAATQLVSVEARSGITTGISAADRARTISVIGDTSSTREDLVHPGHVIPLLAHPRGIFGRPGIAEGATDLARLAGLNSAVTLCQLLDERGESATSSYATSFARRHDLRVISLDDVFRLRQQSAGLVEQTARVTLPTPNGKFRATLFYEIGSSSIHLALTPSDQAEAEPVEVSSHVRCSGGLFRSVACECAARLELALLRCGELGRGVVLYLDCESPLTAPARCSAVNRTERLRIDRPTVASGMLHALGVRKAFTLGADETAYPVDIASLFPLAVGSETGTTS